MRKSGIDPLRFLDYLPVDWEEKSRLAEQTRNNPSDPSVTFEDLRANIEADRDEMDKVELFAVHSHEFVALAIARAIQSSREIPDRLGYAVARFGDTLGYVETEVSLVTEG